MNALSLAIIIGFVHTASAEVEIATALKMVTPDDEIRLLVELAETTYNRHVKAIDYMYRDEPPGGNPVAIVQFIPEPKSERIWVFPAALFYFLDWPDNLQLPEAKRKITVGSWAFAGEIELREKYRLEMSTGPKLIEFDAAVSYEQALQLMRIVEAGKYDIQTHTGNRDVDSWMSSVDEGVLKREIYRGAWRVLKFTEFVPSPVPGESRLALQVQGTLLGMAMCTFSIVNGEYTLSSVMQYVF